MFYFDEKFFNARCSKCESIFSDIHNGQLHEAVCQLALQSEDKMLEPQRNQLLSLKQSDDNVTPYETSFKGRLASYFIRSPCCMDLSMFLKDVRSKIKDIIQKMVAMHSSIKVNLWVDCTFKNMLGEKMTKALKTSNQAIYKATDINEYLAEVFAKLRREMEDAVMSKSGWTLISVDGLRVRIGKYNPLKISSYIPLPKTIKDKKACINVKNKDNQCFMYAMLAKFVKRNPQLPSNQYSLLESKYNFNCIQYPTRLKDISIFEKVNNVSINIFGLHKRDQVYPLKICKSRLRDHRNLLILNKNNQYHFVYIKSLNRLICNQITPNRRLKLICERCFSQFDKRYNGKARFKQHKLICGTHKPARVELPFKKPFVNFVNVERMHKVPVVIYLDFEVILENLFTCQPNLHESYTMATHLHTPMSFCVYVKISDEIQDIEHNLPTAPYLYRGKDAVKHCIMKLKEVAEKIEILYNRNIPHCLSTDERNNFLLATTCYMCEKPFIENDKKVIDHCHLTGKYRGPAHNSCNYRSQIPRFVPVFCHNLSGYDSHFIIKELGYDTKLVEVIPNSVEKYISFSKIISHKMKIKFVDTFRFMASSLDSLSKNLTHLTETTKFISADLVHLVKRKGVFPYEYVSNWDVLDETCLPPIDAFYSSLTGESISENDYQHALQVWKAFSCSSLGEYSDIYLKTDTLLLADIFENFRTITIKSHKLDPAHYFTLPGLSWDAMLRFTNCRLELLTDYEQILMIERGIRGGICQVGHRFAEANNKYLSNYNLLLPSTFITYQDCNNLYGYAMSKYLPYGGFKWVDPKQIDLDLLNETSEKGYILDVTLNYPTSLHNLHNDLPFLAENIMVEGQKKLVPHLGSRVNYICHYLILKQALEHGLNLVKINRVLEFKQSSWLASYINHNTELRKIANNDFEKDLYKLYNNSVFGKTMENVRKRINIKLVTDERKLEKLILQPNCINWTIYNESLAAIHFAKTKILFNKPIYIGLSVLDISKLHMYYYHYDVMLPYYGNNRLKLCYTDTDSFIHLIQTDDLYKDMGDLNAHLDLSNYPTKHPNYSNRNKKVIGKFKDEAAGKIITAFVGLRSKMYAIRLDDDHILKKAKGVKKSVLKKTITFDDYVACLITNSPIRNEMPMFRSTKHDVFTIEQNKVSLCPLDNKRLVLEDGVSTKALEYYRD